VPGVDVVAAKLQAELEGELVRVVKALRDMSVGRLGAPLSGPISTRADAGRMLGRHLALAAQGVEEAQRASMPVWRVVPPVADHVVGDQVNVLARDLLLSISGAPPMVWTPDGRVPLSDVLRDALATTREVHRLL
jgi:hypothetical protein